MNVIARSDDLRRENQRRILLALLRSAPLSRTGLAAATGLSASTVTAITSDLLEAGQLIESNAEAVGALKPAARRGRPQVALARNPAAASIAALTITVNELRADLVDYAGDTVCGLRLSVGTQSLGREAFVQNLIDLVKQLLVSAPPGSGPLSYIAVSVQGVVDAAGQVLNWSPLSSHRDIELAAGLSQAFGVSASLMNDTNMIANALRHREPERFQKNFAVVLLSYGIGMGLVLNGQVFAGAKTSGAEFGHMCHIIDGALCRCGRRGCIEAYASEYGIWRTATGADQHHMPEHAPSQETMAQIARQAMQGDAAPINAYTAASQALGHGLLNLFALIDPIPVAFVGSGILAFDLMEPIIRKTLSGPSIGLPNEGVPMYRYTDNLDLMYEGTIFTGLSKLDQDVVSSEAHA